jgi:zinc protease
MNSSPGELDVAILCKRERLPAVLAILKKMLREPSFPANEFEILKRQTLQVLEQSKAEPQALAVRALRRAVGPTEKDDIRYTPTLEEEIERVKATTIDGIKQLYTRQLAGTAGELVVVGDFDADALTKQVGDILAGWKSEVAYKRVPRKAYPDRKPEKIVINTPDKANALFIVAQSIALKDDNPDYPALLVGNYLLGQAPLASRLSNRVRGKEGLSYSVMSQVTGNSFDPAGSFLAYATCNPTNINKVDKAVFEELNKVVKEGVTGPELKTAVPAYLLTLKRQRSSDAGLAGVLASNLAADRTMKFQAAREKTIANLSVDQVNEAIKKFLHPKQLTVIRAGDFKKVPAGK